MPQSYLLAILRSPPPISFTYPFPWGEGVVKTVTYRRLAGLVSPYEGPPLASLSREDQLRALLAHQEVIEKVMEHPLLPVKFFTLLRNEGEVRHLLSQGYPRLSQALAEVKGVVEMEVAATWEKNRVLEKLSHYPEVVELRQALTSHPIPTLEQRVELGKKVRDLLEQQREEYQHWSVDFLKSYALDHHPHPRLSEEMVVNLAFLVPKASLIAFERRLLKLNQLLQDELNFRLIGPLPPYSFSLVEVCRGEGERIEQARQLLGLAGSASLVQIKRAYFQKAAQLHPDAGGNNSEGFLQLQEAYELLTQCGQHWAGDEEESFPLSPKEVERRFIIKLTRSHPPQEAEG